MKKTKIDWADSTWNPVTGCLHGCEYCYARGIANRFGGYEIDPVGDSVTVYDARAEKLIYELDNRLSRVEADCSVRPAPYPFGFAPTFHRYKLDEPKCWTKPRNIFACSMADLFGEWVPDEWIKQVFEACEAAPQHRFLFLTKNPARFGRINGWNHQYNNEYAKDNMWFGTTITRQCELNRIRELPYGNAHTFLSIEPILERIDLDRYLPTANTRWHCSYCGHYTDTYTNHCGSCGRQGGYSGSFRKQPVNWIILGAESGNRKNKVTPRREWIDSIVQICDERSVPVFMKESLRGLMGDDFRQEFPWEASGDD
ncbi:MAG: DUF5131 family protein [Clostridia bacterium]|nr:DUF5131 family protein [Clostridia bacterium]